MTPGDPIEQIHTWVFYLVGAIAAALGLRLTASKVSRKVTENSVEAEHSSRLPGEVAFWREREAARAGELRHCEETCAQIKAENAALTVQVAKMREDLQVVRSTLHRLQRMLVKRDPSLAEFFSSEWSSLGD